MGRPKKQPGKRPRKDHRDTRLAEANVPVGTVREDGKKLAADGSWRTPQKPLAAKRTASEVSTIVDEIADLMVVGKWFPGKTKYEIAHKHGVSPSQVSEWIQRATYHVTNLATEQRTERKVAYMSSLDRVLAEAMGELDGFKGHQCVRSERGYGGYSPADRARALADLLRTVTSAIEAGSRIEGFDRPDTFRALISIENNEGPPPEIVAMMFRAQDGDTDAAAKVLLWRATGSTEVDEEVRDQIRELAKIGGLTVKEPKAEMAQLVETGSASEVEGNDPSVRLQR